MKIGWGAQHPPGSGGRSMTTAPLRVLLVKPSKYDAQGYVQRYWRGFMPNSTLRHILALTPPMLHDRSISVTLVDEHVATDLSYLDLLRAENCDLLALVGVQSNQWHRALDLAAIARAGGVRNVIIGGPHAMTCQTELEEGAGISIAMSEAEAIWWHILEDAVHGELKSVYGEEGRWQQELDATVLTPPSAQELSRFLVPMLGIYPARGCPYLCNFCSVTQIAGRKVRSQPHTATIETLRRAKAAGVKMVMFTSDNFNKIPDVKDLLREMIEEDLSLPFFVQCDAKIADDEELVELLGRAQCYTIFIGVESMNRAVLKAAHKNQNDPEKYQTIIRLCHESGILPHFSNIIGFPEDHAEDIRTHVRELSRLNPESASFYILCPIPGTEQYADFLKAGIIYDDPNLDRFDATCETWKHPHFSPGTLQKFLNWCYQEVNSVPRLLRRTVAPGWKWSITSRLYYLALTAYGRWVAAHGVHPMSGGVGQKRLDHVSSYLALRKEDYGFIHRPLPENRPLTLVDQPTFRGIQIASA